MRAMTPALAALYGAANNGGQRYFARQNYFECQYCELRPVCGFSSRTFNRTVLVPVIEVDGIEVKTTSTGFLVSLDDWTESVAHLIATADGIDLSDAHWEIIYFIRAYYQQYNHLPNTRVFTKAIQKKLGHDKGNARYLYRLFPDGPLKYAT